MKGLCQTQQETCVGTGASYLGLRVLAAIACSLFGLFLVPLYLVELLCFDVSLEGDGGIATWLEAKPPSLKGVLHSLWVPCVRMSRSRRQHIACRRIVVQRFHSIPLQLHN